MCISFEYPIKGESIFLDYHLLLRFYKGRLCGYHWLPLATIDLVDDNREFEV